MLKAPLEQACDLAEFPAEKRPALLANLIDTLLGHEQAAEKTWTAKVQAERQAPTQEQQAAPPRLPLPEKAPATWKADKQPGDTPPDFIKRHYGPWLRQDGLGISKADIRQLDSSLYMGLLNWLRPKQGGPTNRLPEDCPLPTLSERNDLASNLPIESFPPEDWARLAIAKQRRQK